MSAFNVKVVGPPLAGLEALLAGTPDAAPPLTTREVDEVPTSPPVLLEDVPLPCTLVV
jgi:hypothetical protein